MITAIIIIFVIGYLFITLEHNINLNKTATALLTGVICWTLYALGSSDSHHIVEELSHHLANISEIAFFLLGAMTIVELVDAHQGFGVITERIHTKDSRALLWIISILTFFLSAVLDNLTTAIVMVSLLRKIIRDDEMRRFFAGIVIIAANAGGAWSPLGDVTTTMLWIGGQISAINVMKTLFIPSLIALIVPLIYLSFKLKGSIATPKVSKKSEVDDVTEKERNIMFGTGIGMLLFVPIFKTVTHLPPYMGILLALGVVWIVSEILHSKKDEEDRKPFTASHALSKIDTSSILFFMGILLAIGVLEVTHVLTDLAAWMNDTIGNLDAIVFIIGIASAVIDNVPLVAASMGMYDLATYPQDHRIWEFLAYCAGTGGSMLIIGSAAGVAVMGMERISFFWYLKRISLLALIGYVAGALVFLFV
ncbi:sodium:proton antiporter [Runella sp. CRIBMP]|uniref:sodium:proton antiporter NhaD n=1 Tax=Runella sp. CRIBMP TaxID=2683261 RepID=UPI001412E189|nr:sodium:proton antiporter NhaD [Runella sp. CRIBMP]NBB20783.1 sodium:proton antiporter [Runella sp. CRIBMP]